LARAESDRPELSISVTAPPIGEVSRETEDCAFAHSTTNCGTNVSDDHAVMTPGVATLGAEAVVRIVKTIEVYDDFCRGNDPHEEHDFGSFEIDSHTIFSRSIITIPH
jgi:hypothetical protein